MPQRFSTYSAAVCKAMNASRLQHRGPPISASRARAADVYCIWLPQEPSVDSGPVLSIMASAAPTDMTAPQTPHRPQTAPGIRNPSAFRRSSACESFRLQALQRLREIRQIPAGIVKSGQQTRSVQHVVLRAVHTDKILLSGMPEHLQGIAGRLLHTEINDPAAALIQAVFHQLTCFHAESSVRRRFKAAKRLP